jgi:hypothetical protein
MCVWESYSQSLQLDASGFGLSMRPWNLKCNCWESYSQFYQGT